ncbi:MAG: ABC transporter ATP-binding protein [Bifidobacteriaceae bacterium]|jgi:NitT/TauT family transport system ATP-binding protein|nr:ABC transporter ATP-binding protein [Bifidobacteriaceae bacterium]
MTTLRNGPRTGPDKASPATIRLSGVAKTFPARGKSSATTVFSDLNLHVDAGAFVALAGPSGCGKSTLLRIVAGLTPASAGEVLIDDRAVDAPLPGIAVVFQDYSQSLFPWMTVAKNIALGARRVADRAGQAELAASLLADVGLDAEVAAQHPWQLSGGMQQRVAIARALAARPRVLLLDEPFAAVDAQTRSDLQDLIRALWLEHGMTTVLVTHDIDEAVYTSERVVVLGARDQGVILDTPIDLGRTRDQLQTRSEPGFADARRRVLSVIRRPSTPSQGTQP